MPSIKGLPAYLWARNNEHLGKLKREMAEFEGGLTDTDNEILIHKPNLLKDRYTITRLSQNLQEFISKTNSAKSLATTIDKLMKHYEIENPR